MTIILYVGLLLMWHKADQSNVVLTYRDTQAAFYSNKQQ